MNRLFLALGASLLAVLALAQDRSTAAAGADVYFIAPRAGRHQVRQHGPSSSVDRYGPERTEARCAAAGHGQDRAFRQGPDGDHPDAAAGQAYARAAVRGLSASVLQSAAALEEDHHHRGLNPLRLSSWRDPCA